MSTIQIHSDKSHAPSALNHAVTTTALAGALTFLLLSPVAIAAQAQEITGTPGSPEATDAISKPPYNIVFLIVDQRSYGLLGGSDYTLPGSDAIARHGVTFRNHYISSAMCSPSRASFLTGQPPQVTGVIDQNAVRLFAQPQPGHAQCRFGVERAWLQDRLFRQV